MRNYGNIYDLQIYLLCMLFFKIVWIPVFIWSEKQLLICVYLSNAGVHAVLKTGSWVRYCIFDLATGKAEQENHFPTSNLAFLGQSERNVAIFTAGQVKSFINAIIKHFYATVLNMSNMLWRSTEGIEKGGIQTIRKYVQIYIYISF